jgi:hypothetical protein
VAARATANKTTTKTYTYFAGRFDGHGDALVRYRTHHPMEEVQCFTRSHWTPPGHCHWENIMSDYIKGTYLCWFLLMFFIINTLKTGA